MIRYAIHYIYKDNIEYNISHRYTYITYHSMISYLLIHTDIESKHFITSRLSDLATDSSYPDVNDSNYEIIQYTHVDTIYRIIYVLIPISMEEGYGDTVDKYIRLINDYDINCIIITSNKTQYNGEYTECSMYLADVLSYVPTSNMLILLTNKNSINDNILMLCKLSEDLNKDSIDVHICNNYYTGINILDIIHKYNNIQAINGNNIRSRNDIIRSLEDRINNCIHKINSKEVNIRLNKISQYIADLKYYNEDIRSNTSVIKYIDDIEYYISTDIIKRSEIYDMLTDALKIIDRISVDKVYVGDLSYRDAKVRNITSSIYNTLSDIKEFIDLNFNEAIILEDQIVYMNQ